MSEEKDFPDDKTIQDAISGNQQAVEKPLPLYFSRKYQIAL